MRESWSCDGGFAVGPRLPELERHAITMGATDKKQLLASDKIPFIVHLTSFTHTNNLVSADRSLQRMPTPQSQLLGRILKHNIYLNISEFSDNGRYSPSIAGSRSDPKNFFYVYITVAPPGRED